MQLKWAKLTWAIYVVTLYYMPFILTLLNLDTSKLESHTINVVDRLSSDNKIGRQIFADLFIKWRPFYVL